jgi:hypothetical protein
MRSDSLLASDQRHAGRAMRILTSAALVLGPWSLLAQSPSPASSHVVVFTAHEYAFDGPASAPAGLTTVVVRNTGKEDHEIILVRLDAGKTDADLLAVIRSPDASDALPPWVTAMGGPAEAIPGGESNATLLLPAAHYVLLCGAPAPDGKPHFMKGMMRDLIVRPASTPASGAASLPESDVTITMVDDSFTVAGRVSAGPHRFRVVNAGKQGHMMQMVRLEPGKTVADVLAWDPAAKTPLPIEWSGGMAYMGPGGTGYFSTRLKPGVYGLICFISDPKDHKPHFMHGMQKQFTVS